MVQGRPGFEAWESCTGDSLLISILATSGSPYSETLRLKSGQRIQAPGSTSYLRKHPELMFMSGGPHPQLEHEVKRSPRQQQGAGWLLCITIIPTARRCMPQARSLQFKYRGFEDCRQNPTPSPETPKIKRQSVWNPQACAADLILAVPALGACQGVGSVSRLQMLSYSRPQIEHANYNSWVAAKEPNLRSHTRDVSGHRSSTKEVA